MNNYNNPLNIIRFKTMYQEEVKALILKGLEEHWGSIDTSKNQDIDDIETNYKEGIFLTAWQNGKLVGTGGYKVIDCQCVEIVRMSVEKSMRRKGIGKRLLDELIKNAQQQGYKKIILETTHSWKAVIDFYLNYGFKITHCKEDDVYFEIRINGCVDVL